MKHDIAIQSESRREGDQHVVVFVHLNMPGLWGSLRLCRLLLMKKTNRTNRKRREIHVELFEVESSEIRRGLKVAQSRLRISSKGEEIVHSSEITRGRKETW